MNLKKLIFLSGIYFFPNTNYSQNLQIDKTSFKVDKIINQNHCVFKFWCGTTDNTKKRLIIERINNGVDTIIYSDYIRDGIYKIVDRNNDGYKDFVTNYHDYDVIYFFDSNKNLFKDTPVYMPMILGLIDSSMSIYYGCRDAQYAEEYDYSILYRFNGFEPYVYFKVIYKTPETNGDRKDVNKIELYKFINGKYENPVFMKEIYSKDPPNFDCRKFWNENYQQLLNLIKRK